MTAADLLDTTRRLDIRLSAVDGRLDYDAPAGAMTPELRAELITRKAELLMLLAPPAPELVRAIEIRPGLQPIDIDPILIEAPHQLERVMPGILAAPAIGLDLETTGLDPFRSEIRLVQLATGRGVYVIDVARLDLRALQPVIDLSPCLIAHNAQFELTHLSAHGIVLPDNLVNLTAKPFRVSDTMLSHQLLTSGLSEAYMPPTGPPRPGSDAWERKAELRKKGYDTLENVAAKYLGLAMDKRYQAGPWDVPLCRDQLVYAARDAAVMLPLSPRLHRELDAAGMYLVTALEYAALPALAWLQSSGAPLDSGAWLALAAKAEAEREALEAQLHDLTGATINWRSQRALRELLHDHGVDVEDVEASTLEAVRGQAPELIALLLGYKRADKLAGTYGREFVTKHVHPVDGRIHAGFFQIGARSGRMSSSRPNLQNIPKLPAYRRCVQAPEGKLLIRADLSQVEPKILAEVSGDARLIRLFNTPRDPVTGKAPDVYQLVADELGIERPVAKVVVLATAYGQGAAGLARNLRAQAGLEVTKDQAQRYLYGLLDRYPGLKRLRNEASSYFPYGVEAAPRTAYTLARRRRLNVSTFTQWLNQPIQGTAADGYKWSLARLFGSRSQVPGARLVLAVHDEVVVEVDRDQAETAKAWLTGHMEAGTQTFLKRVPVTVDVSIGRDWSMGAE